MGVEAQRHGVERPDFCRERMQKTQRNSELQILNMRQQSSQSGGLQPKSFKSDHHVPFSL